MKHWIAITVLLMSAGCKQANGQRCQVNSDCISNRCSGAEPKVCTSTDDNMSDIDATPMDAETAVAPDPDPDVAPNAPPGA